MSSSPLRLGVDLPLVRDPGVRFGVEGAIRIRRGVVGTAVVGVTMGITDGASNCIGFSLSSGNWSNVCCDVGARDRYRALVVVAPFSG